MSSSSLIIVKSPKLREKNKKKVALIIKDKQILNEMSKKPVWDVRSSFNEWSNDPAEGEQRLVDVAGLAGPPVDGSRAADVLTAGQIHQIEFADLHQLLAAVGDLLDVHRDRENRVGATWVGVHQSRSSLSFDRAFGQYAVHLKPDCKIHVFYSSIKAIGQRTSFLLCTVTSSMPWMMTEPFLVVSSYNLSLVVSSVAESRS